MSHSSGHLPSFTHHPMLSAKAEARTSQVLCSLVKDACLGFGDKGRLIHLRMPHIMMSTRSVEAQVCSRSPTLLILVCVLHPSVTRWSKILFRQVQAICLHITLAYSDKCLHFVGSSSLCVDINTLPDSLRGILTKDEWTTCSSMVRVHSEVGNPRALFRALIY